MTSSKAELTPTPKYGLTVWMQSPEGEEVELGVMVEKKKIGTRNQTEVTAAARYIEAGNDL